MRSGASISEAHNPLAAQLAAQLALERKRVFQLLSIPRCLEIEIAKTKQLQIASNSYSTLKKTNNSSILDEFVTNVLAPLLRKLTRFLKIQVAT